MRGFTIFLIAGLALVAYDYQWQNGRYLTASGKMLRSMPMSLGLK